MDWSVSPERRNLVSARVPSHFNWPLRKQRFGGMDGGDARGFVYAYRHIVYAYRHFVYVYRHFVYAYRDFVYAYRHFVYAYCHFSDEYVNLMNT